MRNDIQRALQGMPVAASTRMDAYQGTRRMGQPPQMAGRTSAIPPYDYGPEDEPPGRGGRKKWPWIVAGIAALAIIAGLIWGFTYISGSGSSFAVPDVAGLPLAQAEREIVNAHLVAQPVDKASGSVPKGDVISTSPPNGTTVAKGSAVKLFVSTGPAQIPVPNVKGETEQTATSTLQAKGFTVNVQQAPDSLAQAGTVAKQDPVSGTLAAKGSQVTIFISGGGKPVPGVAGQSQAEATTTLENEGFNVSVVMSAAQGFSPGTVWKTSPGAGTVLTQGSTVTIFVVPQPTPTPTPSPTPSPTSSPSSSPPPGGG
jgi:beta-lactam-binding protein with PASTA domain